MSSASLDGLRLKRALATLRDMEPKIDDVQRHMAMLSAKNMPFDAKNLLEISDQITRESMALERTFAGLAAEAKSLARSIPTMPPKQLSMNKYSASSAGELKELSAVIARMPKQLAGLRASVNKFRAFAMDRMNDPDRTPDGGPMDPLSFLLTLLNLILRARKL